MTRNREDKQMRIEHIAVWSPNIKRLRDFYVKYFNAKANAGYENMKNGFTSYFLEFENGSRLEVMNMDGILQHEEAGKQYMGYCHLAMEAETMFEVIKLTEELKKDGYTIIGQARKTGDGYFESIVLDPDGNRVEIVQRKAEDR